MTLDTSQTKTREEGKNAKENEKQLDSDEFTTEDYKFHIFIQNYHHNM